MAEKEELFSTQMRKATRKIHSISDKLVNAKFALSLDDEEVWAGGLFVFYHVFAHLEDAARRLPAADLTKLFVHPTLYRKKAFESDLEHYLGSDWRNIPKSEELKQYLTHLQCIESDSPLLLLAYIYHLYLGLLSGGQILAKKRRIFRPSLAKSDVYIDQVCIFPGVELSQLKEQLRTSMNEIANKLTAEQKLALIEESQNVFRMNNLIVGAVGGQSRVMRRLLFKVSVFVVLLGAVVAYSMRK